jgi:hypothetical protein
MQGHELCSVLTEATVSISANRSRKVAQQMRSAWRSWAFPTRRLATMDAVKSTAAIWSGQSLTASQRKVRSYHAEQAPMLNLVRYSVQGAAMLMAFGIIRGRDHFEYGVAVNGTIGHPGICP